MAAARERLSKAPASLIEQNHDVGVFVGGAESTIVATAVRATKLGPGEASFGDGILVLDELGRSSAVVVATESTTTPAPG